MANKMALHRDSGVFPDEGLQAGGKARSPFVVPDEWPQVKLVKNNQGDPIRTLSLQFTLECAFNINRVELYEDGKEISQKIYAGSGLKFVEDKFEVTNLPGSHTYYIKAYSAGGIPTQSDPIQVKFVGEGMAPKIEDFSSKYGDNVISTANLHFTVKDALLGLGGLQSAAILDGRKNVLAEYDHQDLLRNNGDISTIVRMDPGKHTFTLRVISTTEEVSEVAKTVSFRNPMVGELMPEITDSYYNDARKDLDGYPIDKYFSKESIAAGYCNAYFLFRSGKQDLSLIESVTLLDEKGRIVSQQKGYEKTTDDNAYFHASLDSENGEARKYRFVVKAINGDTASSDICVRIVNPEYTPSKEVAKINYFKTDIKAPVIKDGMVEVLGRADLDYDYNGSTDTITDQEGNEVFTFEFLQNPPGIYKYTLEVQVESGGKATQDLTLNFREPLKGELLATIKDFSAESSDVIGSAKVTIDFEYKKSVSKSVYEDAYITDENGNRVTPQYLQGFEKHYNSETVLKPPSTVVISAEPGEHTYTLHVPAYNGDDATQSITIRFYASPEERLAYLSGQPSEKPQQPSQSSAITAEEIAHAPSLQTGAIQEEKEDAPSQVLQSAPAKVEKEQFDVVKYVRRARGGEWHGRIGDTYFSLSAKADGDGAVLLVRKGRGKDAEISGYEFHPNGEGTDRTLVPFKGYWGDFPSKAKWVEVQGENQDAAQISLYLRDIQGYFFEKPRKPSMDYPYSE
jgi:hypothetical protein